MRPEHGLQRGVRLRVRANVGARLLEEKRVELLRGGGFLVHYFFEVRTPGMRLALAVFAAAVVLAVAERCARAVGIGRIRPDAIPESVIRVCIVCPIRTDAARVVETSSGASRRASSAGVLYELSDAGRPRGAARALTSKGLVDVHTTTPCRTRAHLRRGAMLRREGRDRRGLRRLPRGYPGGTTYAPSRPTPRSPCRARTSDASFAVAGKDSARAL